MYFSSKTINLLGIILVFFGLFTLMLIHLDHDMAESEESKHKKGIDQWIHLVVGFPISVLGALLLILAEKKAV